MEIYIEGLGIENIDILIDIANTKNVALTVELAFRDSVRRGIIPTIMYTNFPILNVHKNLPEDLQRAIGGLVSKNIELERKLISIDLDKAYANSFKARRKSHSEEIQLLKIVAQERDLSPNNFWETAKIKCVEYLATTNLRESKRLGLQDEKYFAQYIRRVLKRHSQLQLQESSK